MSACNIGGLGFFKLLFGLTRCNTEQKLQLCSMKALSVFTAKKLRNQKVLIRTIQSVYCRYDHVPDKLGENTHMWVFSVTGNILDTAAHPADSKRNWRKGSALKRLVIKRHSNLQHSLIVCEKGATARLHV